MTNRKKFNAQASNYFGSRLNLAGYDNITFNFDSGSDYIFFVSTAVYYFFLKAIYFPISFNLIAVDLLKIVCG